MGRVKYWIGICAASAIVLTMVASMGNPGLPPEDPCKLSENQIRKLWAITAIRSRDEAERNRITLDFVNAAESLCRDDDKAKVVPLPPELKARARQ
jgi:hypothetical protein